LSWDTSYIFIIIEVTNGETSPIDALNYLLFHLITAPSTAQLKSVCWFFLDGTDENDLRPTTTGFKKTYALVAHRKNTVL
jgi:hypothetical protein